MAKGEMIAIRKDVSEKEIDKRIRGLEKSARILKRLYFVKYRYRGESVDHAASMVGITKKLGYLWQDRWNEKGFSGLIPRFGGGRPSLLDEEQRSNLIEILKTGDNWSTKEIGVLIAEKYGISYSDKHIREMLRGLGMKFGKPYPHDYRRSKHAESDLKKTR